MRMSLLEDKRAQRPQPSCRLRGRARDTSTMAWTPLLLPPPHFSAGAAPQPCPQAQATQDSWAGPAPNPEHSPGTASGWDARGRGPNFSSPLPPLFQAP